MKNLTIIFTGGTNGLSKEIKKILLQNKFEILNFNKKNYDLSKLSSQKKIQDKIRQLKKKKIIFINIANTLGEIKNIGKLEEKKIVNSININLTNPIILLNFILKFRVLALYNITSGAGFTLNKKLSIYSITKLAMHRFFEFIKKEKPNLIVENIDPGMFSSKMNKILKEKKIVNKKRTAKPTTIIAKKIFNKIIKVIND